MALKPGDDIIESLPKRIEIRFIPHKDHRYPTVGDYFESGEIGNVIINVSKMRDKRYEFLVAIHELVEMCLCDVAGIPFDEIDRFDKSAIGQQSEDPGMEPLAPYRRQHAIAMAIEMLLATEMNVEWLKYESYLTHLMSLKVSK
jgi:hypothetical protein